MYVGWRRVVRRRQCWSPCPWSWYIGIALVGLGYNSIGHVVVGCNKRT